MAFCGQCGTKFEDGVKFCPSCGCPAVTPKQTAPVTQASPIVSGALTQEDIRDAKDNKVMAVLAYILFLIPLLAAREFKFARYHTNQGLVLVLFSVALGVVLSVLTSVLFAVAWGLGLMVGSIHGLLWLVPTILAIIGIIHACKGEMKPLPFIGGITILK